MNISSLVEGNLRVDHYGAFRFHTLHPQHLQTNISKHFGRKIPTSYSGSVALVASAFHPLKTSSSTGDLGIQTIVSDCLGFLLKHYLFILRSSLTLTGPSGPSASADGLGGGESLRQAPFLMAVSLLMGAVMFSSSSSGLPIFP